MLSDRLSDYEVEDVYTTAHVHIRSSRSAEDIGRASGMLHTEEVTGSSPVSSTKKSPTKNACYCSGSASGSCCSMARRA